MKPEISNQDWSEARHTAILINPDMLPGNIRTIAQAIAVAHQRGRREGMEEAAEVAKSWEDTGRSLAKKTLGEEALHHDIAADMASDIKRTIRSKAQEVKT